MPAAGFVTVDVFTRERFAGNPLAVFPDARGLSDELMQKIAAEFGYSEITFVLPPEDPSNDARVRIFTPTAEIPFAGHPNVGTAFVLGQQKELFGKPIGSSLRFEELAGLVEIEVLRDQDAVVGATIRAPRQLDVGTTVPVDRVADCLCLSPDDVKVVRHQPITVSVGLPFVAAELVNLDALAKACPNISAFHRARDAAPEPGSDFSLFAYVRDPQDEGRVRARMFAPLDNVIEDPATGSASAALGSYLAAQSGQADGTFSLVIQQGVEMGRPSEILLRVTLQDGRPSQVLISGHCAMAMRGEIDSI
ncbi:PhzF family phenazine biosynthesis protein [Rhizobium oryzicola]|uniref:PhzF family phenazine biosynthesis protein n=1 Tax=Rhizobium oryzicola TaxID=1232668 RepID=A0ABT8SVY2_9HYPH|nr:PhzF family phenazine biosynthesis protein [Rhizobium oryzicola]MDO1582038.1 PhzF family phenazine biosynthesis protein [Rhizobium oryzicola]